MWPESFQITCDPDIIRAGGYDKTLIDATIAYVTKMLTRAHDADYLDGTMEDFIGDSAAKGWIRPFEPYREVQEQKSQARPRLLEGQEAA